MFPLENLAHNELMCYNMVISNFLILLTAYWLEWCQLWTYHTKVTQDQVIKKYNFNSIKRFYENKISTLFSKKNMVLGVVFSNIIRQFFNNRVKYVNVSDKN